MDDIVLKFEDEDFYNSNEVNYLILPWFGGDHFFDPLRDLKS